MATLTRVPTSLVDRAYPVRWIGTAAEREALTTATGTDALTLNDKKYLFLEVNAEGATDALYMLKDVTDDGPVWQLITKTEIDAADITGLTDFISDANEEVLAAKLDKDITKVSAITPAEGETVIPASVKIFASNDGTAGSITIDQVREFVASHADKLFKGYFATPEALKAGVSSPEDGCYAVVGSTDSIWVWDADNSSCDAETEGSGTWRDTKITGKVDIGTQVIAGTGLEGGGTLATNVTLNVKYGTTSGTACVGDDPRLERGIKWTGTAEERAALTVTEADVNKIFMQKEADAETAELWVLTSTDPTATWVQAGSVTAEAEPITTDSGVVSAGTDKITLTKARPADSYHLEVFLSGVRQMANSWTLDDTNKVITLGGEVPQDIEYDVVIHPLG